MSYCITLHIISELQIYINKENIFPFLCNVLSATGDTVSASEHQHGLTGNFLVGSEQ